MLKSSPVPKEKLVTFKVRGEEFAVLRKEYLEELFALFRSFMEGKNYCVTIKPGHLKSF